MYMEQLIKQHDIVNSLSLVHAGSLQIPECLIILHHLCVSSIGFCSNNLVFRDTVMAYIKLCQGREPFITGRQKFGTI